MSFRDSIDYREELISRRLRSVGRALLITGGKGGVGKSLIASVTALILSKANATGLLDLDLHGPSCSMILGVYEPPVEGDDGLVPPVVEGLKVMGLDLLVKNRPVPLAGSAKEEAIKEILALTDFGPLEYLVVDSPPGSGDELLTVIRYFREKGYAVVVTTPSPLAVRYAYRMIKLLQSTSFPILGVVENLSTDNAEPATAKLCSETGVRLLGRVPYDHEVISAGNGERDKLMATGFAKSIESILHNLGLLS
ncbi:MAG: P-loop NTPase [Candidatus Caldarchaeum sp.]|nr:P-loop NTPase [Candidatus Caldarchaeum sp.]